MNEQTEKIAKSTPKILRLISVLFLAVFAFGISAIIGDLSDTFKLGVSNMGLTTAIFGLFGFIICEVNAKRAEQWK